MENLINLTEEEKDEALELFRKEIVSKIPQIEKLFGRDITEEKIKEVWRENLKNSRVPAVIQLGKYVYGIGGIMKSQYEAFTDEEVFTSTAYLYTSLVEEGIFRDIFYFFNLSGLLKDQDIIKSIHKEWLEDRDIKEIKTAYGKLISSGVINKDKVDERLALILQLFYCFLPKDEIENFYEWAVEKFNNDKFRKHHQDSLKENYDAFYFAYKDKKDVYSRSYVITHYGIIKDISFDGYEWKDEVAVLAQKIKVVLNEDEEFKKEVEREIGKRKYKDESVEDRIYEWLMEVEDMEEDNNFKKLMCSYVNILKKMGREVFGKSAETIFSQLGKIEDIQERTELLYFLILLACGFELVEMKMDIRTMHPKFLLDEMEKDMKAFQGILTQKEREDKRKLCLEKWFRDLENFLEVFVPFYLVKDEFKYGIKSEDYIESLRVKSGEIVQKIKKDNEKMKPTLGYWIGKIIGNFPKIKDDLEKIRDWRNAISHGRGEISFVGEEFEKIYSTVKKVFEEFNEVNFHLLKIKRIVKDCNLRYFIEAQELNAGRRKWYITFDDSDIYDEIDPTFLYYVVSKTNPVARNPFMWPAVKVL